MSASSTAPIKPDLHTDSDSTSPKDGATLTSHLNELRERLILSVIALLVTTSLGFVFSKDIIHWIESLSPIAISFIQLTPGEVLFASLKVAILAGLALASPLLLYHTCRFTLPGLNETEKKLLGVVTVGGLGLFTVGCWFSAQWVVPMALQFLLDYGTDIATNQIQITPFIDFCLSLMIMMGVLFELPLVVWALVGLKLVKPHQLTAQWRVIAVGCFLASAVLTPSQDPFTMLLVGVTLFGLYGLSIVPFMGKLKAPAEKADRV
jgi:sec-independent protein translocase protein TatC